LTGCTPLSKAGIYTIDRPEPRRVVEVYIHDFIRAVLVDLGNRRTLLSLDLYPQPVERPRGGRAISIASDRVELIERECPCPELPSARGALQYCAKLYDCVGDKCEEIEMKMIFAASIDEVLESVCCEELLRIALKENYH